MKKGKTSRKFLATALVAILIISTISMAIPVMARNSGVSDHDVTAKIIPIALSERNFIEIVSGSITIDGDPSDWEGISPIVSDPANDTVSEFRDDDILDVYVTDDGTNLYFMVELGCIPADTWLYLDMDVDQNISTGYNTNTDFEDGYLSSHDTGIDYTIEVDPYEGYADLYAVNETLDFRYIASCSVGLDSVVEVAVPLNEFVFGTLPFNMDLLAYYHDPMDEAPDSGHVTYPFDIPEVPDGVTEYWAIIVGVADYVGTISDLNYADDDAIDMYNTLLSDYYWQADHIQLLIDGDANKSDIHDAFNWLDANEDPDDVVLFFFSGHGTHYRDVEPIDEADGMDEYICPHDLNNIRDDELDAKLDRLGSTSIAVIIDACFSGGMAKASDRSVKTLSKPGVRIADGFASDIASPRGGLIGKTDIGNTGRVVLMGCDDFELSSEISELENGLFSYHVVEGLKGDADLDGNGDGNCSAEETFGYANITVVAYLEQEQYLEFPKQHPQISDGYPGEIPITQIALVANFTGTPRSGPAPLTVEFSDTSISYDGITSWVWDFGDGSINSTDQNPTHVYTTEGSYNVSLTVCEADGKNDTEVMENYITVTTAEGGVPTADLLEVEAASGKSGTYVVVPVNVRNVRNGPVQGIRLTVDYSESVLTLTNISRGDLTTSWTGLNLNEDSHTLIIATGDSGGAIPDGSSGTIVVLNFSVIGSPRDTSPMNLSLIELSNPDGDVGTAPAKNGTFTVSSLGAIAGRITYACNGTEIAGVVVNLTKEGIVVDTTLTNEIGYYTFTDVNPDCYNVNVSKPRFYDNSTEVTVIPRETVDMMLWLKGDLNNDGDIADSGDVMLMLRASVGDIPGDVRYDLNGNGIIADAGDVVLLLRASIGDIILW